MRTVHAVQSCAGIGPPHVFSYQGATKDLRAKSAHEGEIKDLAESGESLVVPESSGPARGERQTFGKKPQGEKGSSAGEARV